MKNLYYKILFIVLFLFTSCATLKNNTSNKNDSFNIVFEKYVEIETNTLSQSYIEIGILFSKEYGYNFNISNCADLKTLNNLSMRKTLPVFEDSYS